MDWIVKLPTVFDQGRTYDQVLVFTDRATKMVHLVPTWAKATAIDTATQFVVNVVKYHGLPRSLISDRNKITLSTFWTHVCAMLVCQSYNTTSFYPQYNGQAERTVQTAVSAHGNSEGFELVQRIGSRRTFNQ